MRTLSLSLVLQIVFACLFPIVVLPAWLAAPPLLAVTSPCAGVGLSGDDQWIQCAGTACPTGQSHCVAQQGNDQTGTYKYCTCCQTSQGVNCVNEESCCHLIARSKTLLEVKGLCNYAAPPNPSCSPVAGQTCQLVSNQPVCQAPPPPPPPDN